jgi:ribose transport system substrate-binding protein
MRTVKSLLIGLIVVAISMVFSAAGNAQQGMKDEMRIKYYDAFKGKRVVFVPMSLGFDLPSGWNATMKKELARLGVKYDVRDPNWNTNAGSRAIAAVIEEKPAPDVLIVHNFDVQSYAQLVKKAQAKGIKVIQINMRSTVTTDAFVGADWVGIGEALARAIVEKIGKDTKTSHKLAIVQGELTSASSLFSMYGMMEIFKKHPEIKIVANQAADWDANKAHDITRTILQQHPDLAAVVGFWDGQDVGTGAAVQEAGKSGKCLVFSGSGGHTTMYNAINKGLIDVAIVYNVERQSYDLMDAIKILLQTNYKAGTQPFALYTPLRMITKDNMGPKTYWDVKDLQENDNKNIITND